MKRSTLYIAIGAGAVLLLAIAAWTFFGRRSKPAHDAEEQKQNPNIVALKPDVVRNAGITIAPAAAESIVQTLKITGIVSPDESRVAHILPLSKGIVEDVYVQLGTRVKRSDPLLVYDNIELGEIAGEHSSLHAQLQRDQAQVEVTKKSLQRAENLIQVEAISPRELELRRAELQQAQAAAESTQANIGRAEEKLHRFGLNEAQVRALRDTGMSAPHRTASHNTLKAPFDGVVTKFDVSRGEAVDQQKELFTIVDTSRVWVLADVYEKDIAAVSRSGRCELKVASYPDVTFAGTIEYLSDALDPQTRTAKLRCVVPNTDGRLKLEMFAEVFVPTQQTETVLTVPAAAVQDIDGKKAVFVVVGPDQFEKREVELGAQTAEKVQIAAGLRAGERVVGNGSFHLKSAVLREEIGEGE